jgi:hypothetical protein
VLIYVFTGKNNSKSCNNKEKLLNTNLLSLMGIVLKNADFITIPKALTMLQTMEKHLLKVYIRIDFASGLWRSTWEVCGVACSV